MFLEVATMAEDWIKIRSDIYRDPKVSLMAEHIEGVDSDLSRYVNQNKQRNMTVTRNVTRNVVVGCLVSTWGVIRHRGHRDGDNLYIKDVTVIVLDDISDIPGFGEAMEHVGWVQQTDEGIVFPSFFRDYNSEPTKSDAMTQAERQKKYRDGKKARHSNESDENVTAKKRHALRNVTTEESRVEENRDTLSSIEEREGASQSDLKSAKKTRKTPEPIMIPDNLAQHPDFADAWSRWEAYRREGGKSMTASTRNLQLGMLAKHGPAKAIEMMERSRMNGWTGLFPPDDKRTSRNGSTQPDCLDAENYVGAPCMTEEEAGVPF